jgi:tRNA-dihydrouridine synthase B
VNIGRYQFSGHFFLAPLAGVSDRPFRTICREMGAAFAYTEMVSAHGLIYGSEQTTSYLDRAPMETPFAVQIFASEPEVLARGAAEAVKHGADIIDINMACPVKKVCSTGAGAAITREPNRVEEAVRKCREATGVPITIKIRAGWDDQNINCVDVAKAAEQGGASAVALHGRTRSQLYSGRANWDLVRQIKEAVGISVIGSGDVWSAADAIAMREQTRCDAVLVARGACGNPWIFRELKAFETGQPTPALPTREEWISTVLRHVEMQIEHRQKQRAESHEAAERSAVRELRKHLLWYTRGRRGGIHFRREADQILTATDVSRLIDKHFPSDGAFELDPSLTAQGQKEVSE